MIRSARIAITVLLCIPVGVSAQAWEIANPEYVGMRVSGPLRAGVPVIVRGQQIRFTLDAKYPQPRDLRVELIHCDRNWVRTPSEFINDPYMLTGRKPLSSSQTAAGVDRYRLTYSGSVPDGAGIEPIQFSGNYIASIMDFESRQVVARFRFSVAERSADNAISVRRRRLPMKIAPWNEAHAVTVRIRESDIQQGQDPTYLQLIRVDLDDLSEDTWIDGLGTAALSFTAGAVMPGNEYRVLDIRSVELYPPDLLLRPRDGADVSRFFSSSARDNNGWSTIVASREFADYERYEFQVWWEADRRPGPIYVLGDFNGWARDAAWELTPGEEEGRYSLRALLKRGRYDYSFSVGEDPILFEGNSWSTTNVYTALTYYGDPRLGGYDRILFVSQVESPASGSETKGSTQ